MTVPEALTDPALRRWPLRRRKVPSAAGTLSFVVPTSSDEVLNLLGDRADPDDLPYWADVWPSSLAIARRLTKLAAEEGLAGWTAVDLGCGVGVAGVGAGKAGARVHFLDLWEDAVRFALFNAKANGLQEPEGRAFDWDRDSLPSGPDPARIVLLMADLFYEERAHRRLHALCDRVLGSGGAVLAGDPCRDVADPWFDEFSSRHEGAVSVHDTHDGRGRVPVRLAVAGPLPEPRIHPHPSRPGPPPTP